MLFPTLVPGSLCRKKVGAILERVKTGPPEKKLRPLRSPPLLGDSVLAAESQREKGEKGPPKNFYASLNGHKATIAKHHEAKRPWSPKTTLPQ